MKAIVSLSGGMDSTTVLARAKADGRDVVGAFGFHYGSKHNRWELEAAEKIAAHYEVPFNLIHLGSVMEGFSSALMDDDVQIPEGHYEAENMRQTVVPARNIIFLSILAGHAWNLGANEVWIGVHSGDHYIYPDCRPQFINHMHLALVTGTEGKVSLQTPFLMGNKTSIIAEGIALHVPYEKTRTCYSSSPIACGRCGSCQERLEAFAANSIADPIEYESRELFPKEGK